MSTSLETPSAPDQQPASESPSASQKLAAELTAMKVDSVTQKLQPGETPQQGILRNNNEAAGWQAKADAATSPVEASNASWEAVAAQAQADALREVHGVPAETTPPPAPTELPANVTNIEDHRRVQPPATLDAEIAKRTATNG